jgi:hypothetical protein
MLFRPNLPGLRFCFSSELRKRAKSLPSNGFLLAFDQSQNYLIQAVLNPSTFLFEYGNEIASFCLRTARFCLGHRFILPTYL